MYTSTATYKIPGITIVNYCSDEIYDRDWILTIAASYYGLTLFQIKKKTRAEEIRLPRQVAMYLYVKFTDLSLETIGRLCGQFDHTTVLHARRKVDEMIETNYKTVRGDIKALEQKITII